MKVEYSTHIEHRLALRKIGHELPTQIYEEADERYSDTETGHTVATMSVEINGKLREVSSIYHRRTDSPAFDYSPLERRPEGKQVEIRTMEEVRMNAFEVYYDESQDILYLAKEGLEHEFAEIAPGVNVELDEKGNLIGIELFNASTLLKNVINPIVKKVKAV